MAYSFLMRKRRGTSLAGAVAVITICLLAVLTVATAASFNSQMLVRSENVGIASNLADSALQIAIAELSRSPDWGSNAATDKIQFDGPVERSSVRVTFDRTLGVPWSTNNQTGANTNNGWTDSKLLSNHKVPEQRVHLVAVAQCRGVQRIREAVIAVPNYTVAIGSTGRVTLRNSLVGSIPSPADLAGLSSDPTLLGPGDLVTSFNDPQAVVLERNSRVAGNVQSGGGVQVTSGSTVGGEVRPLFGQPALPRFEFDDYDPERSEALNYDTLAVGTTTPSTGTLTLSGLQRCEGSARINGDLYLDNCLLFVTNNLTVTGGVRGSGAVIVKGSTLIQGGSNLTSDDSVALLSRGDLSLIGDRPDTYAFQGIVYTQGNFTTRNFTVIGGFMADGQSPGTGQVTMEDSRAYFTPISTRIDYSAPVQVVLQVASTNPAGSQDFAIPSDHSQIYSYGNSPVQGQGGVLPPVPVDSIDEPYDAAHFNNPPGGWDWWNPALVQITREHVNGVEQPVYYLQYTEAGVFHNTRYTTRAEAVEAITQLSATKCPAYNDGVDGHGDPYPALGPYDPTAFRPPPPDGNMSTVNNLGPEFTGLRLDTPEFHRAWYNAYFSRFSSGTNPVTGEALPPWEQRNQFTTANGQTANFSFDPNRFLNQSDKVRISAWTEY